MRLYTLILLLFFSLQSLATPAIRSSVSGKVTDTSGSALPGAVVELPELHTGTIADVDGNYSIPNLPSGDFLITVKLLSFATQTQTIKLNGTTKADFKLSTAVLEQHEIVVTGTSAATVQRRSPTPIQSISAAALRENVTSNVIDAITRMPGVQQLSTGPAISKPIIRGLGYNRIITLNDGIRQEGQQWGDEHGIEIDDYNVSKVEVLKGPASLTYGSDAIAGVINILSEEPAPLGKIQGLIATGYQTNNGQASLHARIAGNEQGLYWSGYYTGKAAHDYKDPYDGYVFNTRFQNNDYGATIGMNKHWGSSRLSFTSFNQLLGIAEGVRDSATGRFLKPVDINGVAEDAVVDATDGKSYSQTLPRQQINHKKLTLINSFYLPNNARIGLSLGLQQNNRKEFGDVLNPNEPGLNLRLRTFNYNAFYRFAERGGWQITAGANGMEQQNTNLGIEFLVPDYSLFDIGGYVTAKKEIGKWSLAGGVRADYRKLNVGALFVDSLGARIVNPETGGFTRFKDFSKSFSSPSGSIGLSYALNKKTTIKANAAAGYRAPNIAELAANGVHEGTIRYEYGNTNLKAENSYQGDLGIEYASEHLAFNAAIFYNHIANFVYTQKLIGVSGQDSIPKENNQEAYPAFQYSQTNANLFGGELFIDFHPHPLDWLHFENTISYVQGRNGNATDSSKYLPNIPATRWLIGLRAQGKKQGKYIGSAYAKLELDNYFAQNQVYSAYGTETASPGYSLLNASLGFDILNKKKPLMSITLAGQNLANIGYQNHLSRLRYADVNTLTGRTGIFGVGRNLSLTIRVPLAFN